MWRTAEKRFMRHVCLRNQCFRGNLSFHSLPEAWGPWERQHTQLCIMVALCPSLRCSRGFGHGVVVSKNCYNILYIDCAPLSLLQTKLLASVGSKQGCRCWQNVMHCRKEICWTCLFQESIPAIPFGNTNHIPYEKLEVPESRSMFQQLCLMLASCTSLCCSCRIKPVSCREAEVLVTELWSPKFGTMQWLCSQLCYVTAANRWTIVEIKLLATVGWKWGCQPFSCRCSQNVTQCQTRFVGHVCFRNPFPPFLVGIPSIQSLPEAWGSWEPQHAPSALHYGCIMHIPSLQLQKKDLSHAEKQRVSSRSCGLQDLLQCSDCALSCAMWLLQTNKQLSWLSFQQQWVGSGAASLWAALVH